MVSKSGGGGGLAKNGGGGEEYSNRYDQSSSPAIIHGKGRYNLRQHVY